MTRYAGTNAVVEITDGTGASTIAVVRSYQLPNLARARIDVTGVADTRAVTLPGRYQATEFRCTEVWDPLNADSGPDFESLIQSSEVVTVKVTTTDGTAPVNSTFTGRVADLIPSEASGEAGLFRDIVILTESDMTHAAPGP